MPLAPVAIPRGHKRHLQRHRLDVQSSAQQLQPSVPPQHCDQAHWDDLIVHVGFERGWETPPPSILDAGQDRCARKHREQAAVKGRWIASSSDTSAGLPSHLAEAWAKAAQSGGADQRAPPAQQHHAECAWREGKLQGQRWGRSTRRVGREARGTLLGHCLQV